MPKLDYYNRNLEGLSYSRRLKLHSCPRKFELSGSYSLLNRKNSVTFAYGHGVAMGLQSTIAGASKNKAILDAYLEYDHDLDDEGNDNEKSSKKSVHHVVLATAMFWEQYHSGILSYLEGWEVAKFTDDKGNEVVGVELTYVVDIGNGYSDEGHIDLVLYHPVKNRYMVVEIKTTGSYNVHPAQYKYSDQPLGYGIVLDNIASKMGATASFDVLYLVYKSRTAELIAMPFTKTVSDRSRWLHELMLDVEAIEKYTTEGHYPHRGESCFDYFRPCDYFEVCKLSDEALATMQIERAKDKDNEEFAQMLQPTFVFDIEELLVRQAELTKELAKDGGAKANAEGVELLLQSIEVTNV